MVDRSHAEVAFACERDGFETAAAGTLLGAFDGRDRRDVRLYAMASRQEQLLASIHEHLHHELQWSTAWGTVAAMSGILAEAGVDSERLTLVARTANDSAREVHEVFATTVSVGVLGVDTGRLLLTRNDVYSGYLNRGLALGGLPESAPWQFRESAIQMFLRLMLQPAELADVAQRGFGALRLRDLPAAIRPNARFASTADLAPSWWEEVYRDLLTTYPERGGDRGDTWSRSAPHDPDEIEQLKRWEESVLIPGLLEAASTRLGALGIGVLDQTDYLEVIDALRSSFLGYAPDDWQVEVQREPRRMIDEPLGVERESGVLWPSPAALEVLAPEDLDARVADLSHGVEPQVGIALYLLPATYRRQFEGAPDVAPGTPPLLALAGRVRSTGNDDRVIPLAFIRPDVGPRQLAQDYPGDCLLLTTLRVTREREFREDILASDEAYVLIDLPLRRQIASWVKSGWTLRFRVLALGPDVPVNLVVFRLDELDGIWFLSYRSDAGFGELAQIIDETPEHVRGGLTIEPPQVARIGVVTSWLLSAWWRLEEVEEWTTSNPGEGAADHP
jgi:hypothetical protein